MTRLFAVLLVATLCLFPASDAAAWKPGGWWPPPPVTVSVRRTLDFGSAASDISLPGTVVLNPVTGAKTVTGGAVDFGGHEQVAEFKIEGQRYANVFVVLPSSITLNTGGGTMTIDNFTMNASNPINLGHHGRATIKVGATLHLNAGQQAGGYNGNLTISADY